MKVKLLLISVAFFAMSCDGISAFFGGSDGLPSGEPVAKVGDHVLREDELAGLVPRNASNADSLSIVKRYVASWVRRQLLLEKAEKNSTMNEADINRRVQEYKYQLLVYEYQKKYISENLDTAITEDQVMQYYNENVDNFQLKQNIIKGMFMKIKHDVPNVAQAKKWFRGGSAGEIDKLQSFCYTYASTYHLNDTTWLDFDELTQKTPFASIPNKVQYLKQNKFVETSDSSFIYMLKITEYKMADQTSPIDFARAGIREIVLNKRVFALKTKLEDEIYDNATKNNDYEIFE